MDFLHRWLDDDANLALFAISGWSCVVLVCIAESWWTRGLAGLLAISYFVALFHHVSRRKPARR